MDLCVERGTDFFRDFLVCLPSLTMLKGKFR